MRTRSPITTVARYVAIGSGMSQTKVVVPSPGMVSASVPLAATVRPSGTVMRKVKAALSEGWSLPGNQVRAASGSATTKVMSPASIQPSGKPMVKRFSGVPW